MGLTQHKNGVAVIQEVVNMHLLGGHIGKEGAAYAPFVVIQMSKVTEL